MPRKRSKGRDQWPNIVRSSEEQTDAAVKSHMAWRRRQLARSLLDAALHGREYARERDVQFGYHPLNQQGQEL